MHPPICCSPFSTLNLILYDLIFGITQNRRLVMLSNYRNYQIALHYLDIEKDPNNVQVKDSGRPYFSSWRPDSSGVYINLFRIHPSISRSILSCLFLILSI